MNGVRQSGARVGAALAVLIGSWSIAASQGGPPPPAVTVAAPVEKKITNWDEYWGRFEAVASVEVRPRVSGFIEKIHFKDGQIVKEGDLLYTIDQRQFRIAVDSARAEVTRTKAQVQLADNEVERARPLLKSAAVTERDFDQRRSGLSVAKAQLQSAQASLDSAELNVAWTEVRAPISGRISDSKEDAGSLVSGGNSGTTLLTTIVSLDPIHFVFDAAEADYLRYMRLGTNGGRRSSREVDNPVKIKLADEDGWGHEGTVDFVDNQLNARSGTMRARAIVSNKDQVLAPGLFGRIKVFGGEAEALLIPDKAVVADQTRKIVYVVGEDDMVKAAPVTLGSLDAGLRVVMSGLSASDRVIIEGHANPFVRPGAKVAPQAGEIKAASGTN